MICKNCSKLAMLKANKKCKKCNLFVNNNLSVICDSCSTKNNICSICLKHVNLNNNIRKSCNCGRK